MQTTGEEKKNVTVQIFGSEYPISGAKDPAHVEELARYVDSKMKDIAKGSPLLSAGKVAILAALNMADEFFRLRDKHYLLQEKSTHRLADLIKKIDGQIQKG